MKEFENHLIETLDNLKNLNLGRKFKISTSKSGSYVEIDSKKVLQMSSNNYLGLAGDPRLQEAAIKAIEKYGIGSTGSRLISGTSQLHIELEEKLAEFKGTERTLVFATGYMANVGTISALLNEQDAVYSDELNHASIIDGIKLSRANKFIYKHCDIQDLERLISENHRNYRFNVIITDSIFSMDGDRAPLKDIVKVKDKYGAVLFVDEAHAFGVYGPNGEGLAHELGINDKIDIQMGTFSKAAGSEGGYIAGKEELIEYLINKSRSFIYSTAPAIPSIAALIEAISIIKDEKERRFNLHKNIKYLKVNLEKLCQEKGYALIPSESAIFCIEFDDIEKTLGISQDLFEKYNILAIPIRPPTVKTPRIRFSLMAIHCFNDLDCVINSLNNMTFCK